MGKETLSRKTLVGLKRRDVFRLGAAAAAGAGVVVLSRTVAPRRAGAQWVPELPAAGFGFNVHVAGLPGLSTSVLRVNIDPLQIKAGRTRPRKALFPEATFVIMAQPVTEVELRSWVEPALSGSCERKMITINLYDATGVTGRTINLMECFPVRWSFEGYDLPHETPVYSLTVQANGVEMS
jgi:hypothetical protein